MRTTSRSLLAAAAIAVLGVAGELSGTNPFLLGGHDAGAVIGRPLTPMSYAGVARRTTRRAAYAGAYGGAYGGYAYAPPPPTVVATLPPSCARVIANGVVYYQCGTARYQPYYDGPTVVYQPM